jgi:transcriptional regulator with GAF, ATPase, and Fis domain
MQLILYSKNSEDPATPVIIDRPGTDKIKITKECTRNGTICLISPSSYEAVNKIFEKAGYLDCGEKAKKIDLKRALKFDEKKNRNLSKKLVFNSTSTGAFKRALGAFLTKHYAASDPPCLIIIPEVIHTALMMDASSLQYQRSKKPLINENDPLLQLIRIPESDPRVKKLGEVYIGNSFKVKHTRALMYRASLTDSPVLILGESGTGKDVIASQIYKYSTVYKKDFFRINCSALPESLLEGELFGYKKGIFTGAATDKEGLFTVAENGTIFLDEIGDLSLANQVKILHAVEKKEIRQIGSARSKPVNVRIIAATNRNLDAMMMQGAFREDLYYRISTFRITSPPLREHPEDIPLLAISYWKRKLRKGNLSREFLDYLKDYHWPGNVRELNSLLNSVVDYFGDISPTPRHVDAIRKSRQEMLVQSARTERDDPSQLLKIKSQNILINIQNILRSLKIEIQPVVSQTPESKYSKSKLVNLKEFIIGQIRILNDLCLEPAYFKQWEIFEATTHYRHILEQTVKGWTASNDTLRDVWKSELKLLDEKINQGIMEVIWGKIDM